MVLARLRRFAFAQPHVLVLSCPGGAFARVAVEQWSAQHGWSTVIADADADIVVICGTVPDELQPLVDATIARIPVPRAVVTLTSADEVDALGSGMQAAAAELLDWPRQQRVELPADSAAPEMDMSDDDGDMDMDMDGDMDMGGMDHGGHGGGGAGPGGLSMADRAEDRDGLKLDVLHVPLGPLLPAWPAGLVLATVLQGDVITQASVHMISASDDTLSFWDRPWRDLDTTSLPVAVAERRRAAAHLDSLARFLAVAGHDGGRVRTLRLRDDLMAGEPVDVAAQHLAALARQLRCSRLLSGATQGLGVIDEDLARQHRITGPALRAAGVFADARSGSPAYPDFAPRCADGTGDVRARWRQWLVEAAQGLQIAAQSDAWLGADDGREGPRGVLDPSRAGPSAGLVAVLPRLVTGQTVTAARLIVASLDPDCDEFTLPMAAHDLDQTMDHGMHHA